MTTTTNFDSARVFSSFNWLAETDYHLCQIQTFSRPTLSKSTLTLSKSFIQNHSFQNHSFNHLMGARDGAVVRALTSHQCGPGSTPGVDAICGLSLLLVLSLAPRGFSPVIPVFPSPQKPTLPNSNSIWNPRRRFVGKQAIYNFTFFVII